MTDRLADIGNGLVFVALGAFCLAVWGGIAYLINVLAG